MIYVAYNSETGAVDEIAYSRIDMVPAGKAALSVTEKEWCAANGKVKKVEAGIFVYSDPPPTVADYDKAMEDHLLAERVSRGYTSREPSDYAGSTVRRFAQDAADWIAHRDAVMLYALDVMNHYAETGEAPPLSEFRENLPKIKWTLEEE